MNSKKFYDTLEKMEDLEILNYISASIEYLVNRHDFSFNKVIRHLKKTHNYLLQIKDGE